MGALCPRSNTEAFHVEQNRNEIIIDPQVEFESLINQETNYKLSLSCNFSLNNPTLQTCDQVIQSILSISLSFMVKDFSEHINFFKWQIHKQIQDLINHQIDFQDELLKTLVEYYEFLSYVQENGVNKVVTWWKEPKTIVDLQHAILVVSEEKKQSNNSTLNLKLLKDLLKRESGSKSKQKVNRTNMNQNNHKQQNIIYKLKMDLKNYDSIVPAQKIFSEGNIKQWVSKLQIFQPIHIVFLLFLVITTIQIKTL